MKDLPLVSICIPAYNHERYVQEAIRSAIDQDYPRIELIVIDDGSKDSTWAKIKAMRAECEKRFERVVMYSRSNRGRVATCSELRNQWQGEYVGMIASDDRYLPKAISTLVKALNDDLAIGVAVGTNIIVDADGRRCYWDELRNIVYEVDKARFKTFDAYIENYSGVDFSSLAFGSYAELAKNNHIPNGQLLRRSYVEQIVAYDEKAPLEDLWFNLQMAKVARFKHVNAETFAYRWHGANTVTQTEYMWRIVRETLYREMECLEKRADAERWKESFVALHPEFKDDVWEMWIGKHHRPHIVRIRTWGHVQYILCVKTWRIPLTPQLRTM